MQRLSVIAAIVTCRRTCFLRDSGLIILRVLCLAGLLIPFNCSAFLDLKIEKTSTEGWLLEGLEIGLKTLQTGQEQLVIRVAKLHSDKEHWISDVRVVCPEYHLDLNKLECLNGHLSAHHPALRAINADVHLSYNLGTGVGRVELMQLGLADSLWQVLISIDNSAWSVQLESGAVKLPELSRALSAWLPALEQYSVSAGQMQISMKLSGHDGELRHATIDASIGGLDLAASNSDDSTQTEKLGFSTRLEIEHVIQGSALTEEWKVAGDVMLDQGLAYIEPGFRVGQIAPGFYLEFQPRPMTADLVMHWLPAQDSIDIQRLRLNQQAVMQVHSHGRFSLATSDIEDMYFAVTAPALHIFYTQWLQPLLLDTVFNQLQTSGVVQANVHVKGNHISDLGLRTEQLFLEDKLGRFNLYGLNGDVILNSGEIPRESHLSWQGAGIYKLDLGATELQMQSSQGLIKLQQPTDIPILDGVLKIDRLELDKPGQADVSFYLDGLLTPISLQSFSQAMGWPIMAGKLSGIIPGLRYEGHRLTMDGNLLVRAFDGSIPIRGLEVRDLFGQVPRLEADIDIHGLNLETLTSTFSFGKITGQLDGFIHDLKLEAWQPASFTAAFTNPPDDEQPHRISQRAVDDLTSIGGGLPTAGISGRFMQIFDDFSYGQIGLSCRLQNGVCYMGGVQEEDDSYAILTRGFLPPWISIQGYNRRVDWSVLMERLRDIVRGEAPIIQ